MDRIEDNESIHSSEKKTSSSRSNNNTNESSSNATILVIQQPAVTATGTKRPLQISRNGILQQAAKMEAGGPVALRVLNP